MPKILVVDDDTTFRERVYDLLTRKRYEVVTAASSAQALELLKTQRPQAILLDAVIAGSSGLEMAAKVREFDSLVSLILLKDSSDSEPDPAQLKRFRMDVVRKETEDKAFQSALEAALTRALKAGLNAPTPSPLRMPGPLLLVDDDPAARRMLQICFEARGFRVLVASSGEEAVKAAAKKPALVLLDMNMPGMDGLVTLKKLKAVFPKLPVIMASAVGEEATVREALEAGAYDYVMKPFNIEYLETVVLTKILMGLEA